MKKISTLVALFIISVIALTKAGVKAAIDGAISVVSSDPSVLEVLPSADGSFHIKVVGVGHAILTVTGDADLGDGVRQITQSFEFEVYDGTTEADHFDLSITEVVPVATDDPADPATDTTGETADPATDTTGETADPATDTTGETAEQSDPAA